MESELLTLRQLLQNKENELQTIQSQFEQYKQEATEHKDKLQTDNQQKDQQINESKAKLDASTKEVEAYRNEISQLTLLVEQEKGKLQQSDQEKIQYKSKVVTLEQDNASLETEIRNTEFEKGELQDKVEKLEEMAIIEKEALQAQFNEKLETLEKLKREVLGYQEEIASLQKREELASTEETRSSSQPGSRDDAHVKHLEEIISQYKEEVNKLNEGMRKKEEEVKSYAANAERMQEEIEQLNENLRQKELDALQEENELERTRYEIQMMKDTLEETDKQIQELNLKLRLSPDRNSVDKLHEMERQDCLSSSRDLEALKKNLKEMGFEIASLSDKIRHEKETNVKLQRETEKNAKEMRSKEKKLMAQKNEISDLKASLSIEKTKGTELEKKVVKLTKELDENNKKVMKAQKGPVSPKKIGGHERKPSYSPEKPVNELKLIMVDEMDITHVSQRLDTDNGQLPGKLAKMAEDVELLASTMATLQADKQRLEEELLQREHIIHDLAHKYQANHDLLGFIATLEEENNGLAEKLNRMMGNVELLASKVSTMQEEKVKLEEEVTKKDGLIDGLVHKFQENSGLVGVVQELEEENAHLSQKLGQMEQNVGVLSSKFMQLHGAKVELEADAARRENIIDDLTNKYNELERVFLSHRIEEENSTEIIVDSLQSSQKADFQLNENDNLSQSKASHLQIDTDSLSSPYKAISGLDTQYSRSKGSNIMKPRMSSTLAHSWAPELGDLSTKTDLNSKTGVAGEHLQPEGPKIFKYLYAKSSRSMYSSIVRFDNNQAIITESSGAKNSKGFSGHLGKSEKTVAFSKIMQKLGDMDMASLNLKGENILGKNLFFLLYGAKKTEKKLLKYKLVSEIIENFKNISNKNPEKLCGVVIRVQDDKFFKKLETSKNFTALEQFSSHTEFILDTEERIQALDEFINELKQLDTQGSIRSSRVMSSVEKSMPKEIFIEFLMQNKEETNHFLSEEDRYIDFPTRTKIMIVTTNNVRDERDLDEYTSVDSMVDYVLTGNKKGNNNNNNVLEGEIETERKILTNNVEKFFILTIQPGSQTPKSALNTLALASRLNDLGRSDKIIDNLNDRRTSNSMLLPSKKADKAFEPFDPRMTPTKKEKLSNLKILQNSETPKSSKKKSFFQDPSPSSKNPLARGSAGKTLTKKAEAFPSDRRVLTEDNESRRDYERITWPSEINEL